LGEKRELVCLQLGLARQKENVEYIKSYIQFAKQNGYNAVLVYLENVVRTSKTEFTIILSMTL